MISRRSFLGGSVALLAAPPAAGAQQAGKVWKIGALWTSAASSPVSSRSVLRQALRELGYVEDRNLIIQERFAEARPERLRNLAAELIQTRPDVIVTQSTPAAKAVKERTGTIPIVMVFVCDPVGTGLISSLAHPGGNVTGLTQICPELNSKRLQMMKEALPRLSQVAVLWDSTGAGASADAYGLRATEDAARKLRLALQVLAVRSPNDFPAAFDAAATSGADGLIILPSSIFGGNTRPLAELALKHELPAMYQSREFVESGGLISYGPSLPETYRQVAIYVDKILKGAKPADLPVEQPRKFELAVNLKTAKALGLTIPQSLLLRAEQVIE